MSIGFFTIGATAHCGAENDFQPGYPMVRGLAGPTFPFAVRAWQIDDGLPDNRVQAIAQTPDGYLWAGTGAGLARFDGVRFTVFDLTHSLGINGSSVTCLCTDRAGTL
jgi:hypothetical protein